MTVASKVLKKEDHDALLEKLRKSPQYSWMMSNERSAFIWGYEQALLDSEKGEAFYSERQES